MKHAHPVLGSVCRRGLSTKYPLAGRVAFFGAPPSRALTLRMSSLAMTVFLAGATSLISTAVAHGAPADAVEDAIASIRELGPNAQGQAAARAAVATLAASGGDSLLPVLEAMQGANPLAKNWLSGVAGQLYDQRRAQSASSVRQELNQFYADRSNDADARYLVFRWLVDGNDGLRETMLEAAIDDPSLPLRFLAHERLLKNAEAAAESDAAEAQEMYATVMGDARNPEQLRRAANALTELGVQVDLAEELGMFARWYLIAPFDNTDGAGFEEATPLELDMVERKIPFDVESQFLGKSERVGWQPASTDDSMGSLDLNPIFDNAKDATCYAYCVFQSDAAKQAVARLGSINANKVWVNGELITANEVYHSGSRIDQYNGPCELKAGKNWVLIKICQNAQTETWAQDWQFQFRITDASGKPEDLTISLPQATELSE